MERCGVDYFDVYLLHNLGRDRYVNTERFGGFAVLRNLKEQGLVRNILRVNSRGVSDPSFFVRKRKRLQKVRDSYIVDV